MKIEEYQILKILNERNKKRGLLLGICSLISIYFFFFKPILKEYPDLLSVNQINILIPIILILLIYILWLFTSNRIALFRTGELRIGLFFNLEDEIYEEKLKKISENIIDEIKEKHNNIKITFYPINFKKSKISIKKYLENNKHIIDCIVYAKISSGNIKINENNSENHLIIDEINFIGNFNVNEKLRIFKTSIKLSNELKIRNLNKNWSYVESNSLNDKKKIQHNLKDIILFYSGIYLIYERKIKSSLNILKTLHSKQDSTISFDEEKKEIKGNKNFILASRLNDILLNLFIINARISYENLDKNDAYNSLKECEKIFPYHAQSFDHFISLARYSYDLGKIEEAKKYTKKAKEINKTNTAIFLNEGFFGILDQNENVICYNYEQLRKVHIHKKSLMNFTEIIGWLNDEKKKNNNQELFDFIIGFLNFFYSDKKNGEDTLKILVKNFEFAEKYPKVNLLCNKILNEGEIKSNYFRKYN
jgi:hypothetical protein